MWLQCKVTIRYAADVRFIVETNTAMPLDSHKPYSHNYKILFYDDYDEKDVCMTGIAQ